MTLRPNILIATVLTVLLAGCGNLPIGKSGIDREMEATPPAPTHLPKPAANEEEPIKINSDEKAHKPTKAEVEPGSASFLNEQAAKKAPAGVINEEGQITLNYENMPIQGVVQNILGALLKENYTIAPTVTGNVTFSTAKPITPAQAMPILEMLLGWTNNALIVKEGRYEVVPVKDALPGNLTPRLAPPQMAKGYEVRVFPLKYIAPKEMQKLLKPYAKVDAFVTYDDTRNFIVMAGTAAELANYQRTIEVFDVDWLKGMSVGVYGLRNVDVTKVLPDLDKIFGTAGESPLAGMFRFIPMETTNSVVVITPQPEYLKQAETWLYRLDQGVGENGTQLYVYDVKNVKAVDLSDHLNAIFTGQASQKPAGGNVAPGLKPVSIGQFNAGNTGRGTTGATGLTGAGATGQSKTAATGAANTNLSTTGTGGAAATNANGKQIDIRITAIEENNQLLIMATPGEWDSILAAIHRLDVSPLQVQIEAKILEVKLSGKLAYGVQWWLSGLINTGGNATGIQYGRTPQYPRDFTGNPQDRHRASLGAGQPVSGGAGLFYSFLNHDFQVAFDALQTDGTTKVLSTPSLVVMNNQQAQITVGSQVSVISQSLYSNVGTTTSTTGNTVNSTGVGTASYISTGVTLDITPRVNPGGLVYMDVSQEDTSPDYSTTTPANPNPSITQRNLKTQVAVQSGETVLLGGMISENEGDTKQGVPLLSSIPIVGGLFGNTNKNRDRTELIVLITPRVITNPEEAREMTREYQQKFESLKPLHAKQAEAPPAPVPPAQSVPAPAKPVGEP